MELTFAAATDVGRQRTHNEDNFLIDKKLRLFLIADGMGGHAAGEVASSIAVHEIRDAVYSNRDLLERYRAEGPATAAVEILQMLEHAVQAACGAVYSQAQADSAKRGMGTTASVLLIAGAPDHLRGFIAHVGDSRIYLARQGQSHQLTEDHSLMNELVRRGKLKRDQVESSPYKQYKNAVTRAVGVYASVEVDTFDFDILPGDRFLLCSDGLYAYLEDEQLPALLGDGEVKDVPRQLIDLANEGGGHDNITGVVLRVGGGTGTADAPATGEASLKLDALKGMQMFRYLSYRELVRVASLTAITEADAGAVVFTAGDPGETMYVVASGRVRLSKGDVHVAELTKGQHFGEMALIDRSTRSLTATAAEPTQLVTIRRKDFYEIIKKESELATKLLWSFVQVLGARLRKTTSDLSDALHGDKHGGDTTAENLFQD
ncbi:MAG: cyclic nucleotide-binding domain-containing protein [Kofleriaceae bacterium]